MNRIEIFAEVETSSTQELFALMRTCAETALAEAGAVFEAGIDITIVDAETIRGMNREHRCKDAVTDVLSFPMFDFCNGTAQEPLETDPETGCVMLGDMVICLDRAEEQAAEYGHSVQRECGYLTIHSVLHLLGFDHERGEEDRMLMREKEKACLRLLSLFREDDV